MSVREQTTAGIGIGPGPGPGPGCRSKEGIQQLPGQLRRWCKHPQRRNKHFLAQRQRGGHRRGGDSSNVGDPLRSGWKVS